MSDSVLKTIIICGTIILIYLIGKIGNRNKK